MTNTTTNKTAEEIQEFWYQRYRNTISLNRHDAMINAMNEFASLQTEAKDRELEGFLVNANSLHKSIQKLEKENDSLESSLSLAKKENEELKEINSTLSEIAKGNGVTLIELQSELTSVKEQLQTAREIIKISNLSEAYRLLQEYNTKLVEALEDVVNDADFSIPKAKKLLAELKEDTNKNKD